jgi:sodium-dependent phosphate transporter
MIPPIDPTILFVIIPTFVVAFFLAFGVGANDVANSFGTSVGSGVLTLRQACILATIFEVLGAVLIGYQVSDTVRKGVFDVADYYGEERLLMYGYLSALIGGAVWNLIATFLKLPISGTHSIIGAVLGFHVVCKGMTGIKWTKLSQIVLSWFVSPLTSGLVSVFIFMIIHRFIISREKSLQRGLIALPFFYGFTVFINAISIVADGPKELMLNNLSWYVFRSSA